MYLRFGCTCSATKGVSPVSRQTHASFNLASTSDERFEEAELWISAQFNNRNLCALYMQPLLKSIQVHLHYTLISFYHLCCKLCIFYSEQNVQIDSWRIPSMHCQNQLLHFWLSLLNVSSSLTHTHLANGW